VLDPQRELKSVWIDARSLAVTLPAKAPVMPIATAGATTFTGAPMNAESQKIETP
jgi:hypothetical protein